MSNFKIFINFYTAYYLWIPYTKSKKDYKAFYNLNK
jgi:hypothetical protein